MTKQTIGALQHIISAQNLEIQSLRKKLDEWETSEIGEEKRKVQELEAENANLKEHCDDLEVAAAAMACASVFLGTGLLGLLSDRITEFASTLPDLLDEATKREIRDRLDEHSAELVEAVIELDTVVLKAFEREYHRIHDRIESLPPFQRVIFEAMNQLTKPNKLGSTLLDFMKGEEMFAPLLKLPYIKERLNLIGTLLDVASGAWPLAAINAFTPLLRLMGVDEAAEAAAEILDSLDNDEKVPRRFVPKVKADLVKLGAIQERTKLDTVSEYLIIGHQLEKLGLSPEQASYTKINASVSNLKRAQKTYRALLEVYDRQSEDTSNEFIKMLDWWKPIAEALSKGVNDIQEKAETLGVDGLTA